LAQNNMGILTPAELGRTWLGASSLCATSADEPELVVKGTFLEFQFKNAVSRPRSSSVGTVAIDAVEPAVSCTKPKCSWADAMDDDETVSTVSGGDRFTNSCSSEAGDQSEVEQAAEQQHSWVPVWQPFVPAQASQPTVAMNIAMLLQARKAALGSTVNQLAAAALQAEAGATYGRAQRPTKRVQAPVSVKPAEQANADAPQTTLMLRHVPVEFSRASLLKVLNEAFEGCYDFVYLPINFESGLGFGFAFINFSNPTDAERARQHFEGFTAWGVPCKESCETCWSDPYQGLAANIERYRNSPVMHESVPEEHKPLLFVGGRPASFPAPSRKIKAPRVVRRSSPHA
jgi:hypothetical protein